MQTLVGKDREEADRLLEAIAADGRLEFIGTNEDRDFVENCQKVRHIHWPVEWLERLRDIAEQLA